MKESITGPQILVINCGSSSIKFSILETVSERVLAQGLAQKLGTHDAEIDFRIGDNRIHEVIPDANHHAALENIIRHLETAFGEKLHIAGVGHRVVHGGEFFRGAIKIDGESMEKIESVSHLAPMHNPANLDGIRAAKRHFPEVPQIAVFDTAFHHTLPPSAFLYAIPYHLYEKDKVRRYGFHGTSHQYVAQEAARRMGRSLTQLHLLTAHLGNGCSACAVREGKSVDTTMGLTPLEGLVMGTRSGDLDPNVLEFVARAEKMTLHEVTDMLNRQSGLLGLSGASNDMRSLQELAGEGHVRARIAINVFCYRLAKNLLGLMASLDRVDALILTGGIGENCAAIRAQTLDHLQILHPEIDPVLNADHGRSTQGRITRAGVAGLLVLAVPTNEELMIARETAALIELP